MKGCSEFDKAFPFSTCDSYASQYIYTHLCSYVIRTTYCASFSDITPRSTEVLFEVWAPSSSSTATDGGDGLGKAVSNGVVDSTTPGSKNPPVFLGLGIVSVDELLITSSQKHIIPLQGRPFQNDSSVAGGLLTIKVRKSSSITQPFAFSSTVGRTEDVYVQVRPKVPRTLIGTHTPFQFVLTDEEKAEMVGVTKMREVRRTKSPEGNLITTQTTTFKAKKSDGEISEQQPFHAV